MPMLALLIGAVAGLRAMTAPAAVSWAAYLGLLRLEGTPLAFLAHPVTPWIFTALALGELAYDQWPGAASRTQPGAFAARIASGALCGAALHFGAATPYGLAIGVLGAVVGTIGGRALRAKLANAFHADRPAAFLEDAGAIGTAALTMSALG